MLVFMRLSKAITCVCCTRSTPGAYKDIDVVMDNQKDLTETLHTPKQVVCVKGSNEAE